MDRIRVIESEIIDKDIDNLDIYNLSRNNALKLILRIYEWKSMQLTIAFHEKKISQESISSIGTKFQKALSLSVKKIYQRCSFDVNISDYEIYQMKLINYAEILFDKAILHSWIEEYFTGLSFGLNIAPIKEESANRIVIELDHVNEKVSLLEIVNNLLLEEHNKSQSEKMEILNKRIAGKYKNILKNQTRRKEFCKDFSNEWTNLIFNYPEDLIVAKYSIKNLKYVWSKIMYLALLKDLENLFNSPDSILKGISPISEADLPCLASINLEEFDKKIIDKSVLESILIDMSYTGIMKGRQKYSDLMTAPIIEIDNIQYIAPRFFLNNLGSRNVIANLNRIYEGEIDKNTELKEAFFLEEIDNSLKRYPNLKRASNIKLEDGFPDIDYALYDSTRKVLLLLELKWITEPHTSREIISRDEDISKGVNIQLIAYIKAVESDVERFMLKAFDEKLEVKIIESFVTTKISLGSGLIENIEKVINVRMLKRSLTDTNGNLEELILNLRKKKYWPIEGIDFEPSLSVHNIENLEIRLKGFRSLGNYSLKTEEDFIDSEKF